MIGKHANLNKTVKEEEASVSEDTHVLNTTSDIKKPLTKKKVAKRKRVSKKEDIECSFITNFLKNFK
uniref:Uncharacterized protein n=1 Tax=Heterorhabditis bacteriophora TaxID=37862 RepID=A0A1I7XUV4_HETBA